MPRRSGPPETPPPSRSAAERTRPTAAGRKPEFKMAAYPPSDAPSCSLDLFSSNPIGRQPGVVSNHRNLDLRIACSEEKVIRKHLQIASTSAARIEMVTLRESPGVIEGLGELYPEILSNTLRDRFVVFENFTNLSLDCRMIEDLPAHRPTALRSWSWVKNSAVPASISASLRASSSSSGPEGAPRRLARRCAAKPARSSSQSWSTSGNTSISVFMG